ncbi:MAG: septum formation initiator family protein [Comamonas sp.]|jgi:cell division protein FtsB|nr:septum formation initiator family protein [Comamonas sp.]MBS7242778.1 septum formation initiator family protein [Comamonas sp.]
MLSRIVTLSLLSLLGITHAQLWLGAGSMDRVAEMRSQINELHAANDVARKENDRLTSEVEDLRDGQEMVEEKARSELGMVKPNEMFVHIMRR